MSSPDSDLPFYYRFGHRLDNSDLSDKIPFPDEVNQGVTKWLIAGLIRRSSASILGTPYKTVVGGIDTVMLNTTIENPRDIFAGVLRGGVLLMNIQPENLDDPFPFLEIINRALHLEMARKKDSFGRGAWKPSNFEPNPEIRCYGNAQNIMVLPK